MLRSKGMLSIGSTSSRFAVRRRVRVKDRGKIGGRLRSRQDSEIVPAQLGE